MRVPIHGPGVHTTQGMSQFQLDFEQKSYNEFVGDILSYLSRAILQPTDGITLFKGVSIVSQILPTSVGASSAVISDVELAKMPGDIVGNYITLKGSITQVNFVLRDIYYYARSGSGDAFINITVIDTPATCSDVQLRNTTQGTGTVTSQEQILGHYKNHQPQNVVRVFTTPVRALELQQQQPLQFGIGRDIVIPDSYPYTTCDSTNKTNIVSSIIPIYITPLNQAPSISFPDIPDAVTAVADFAIALPDIVVSDTDHINILKDFNESLAIETGAVSQSNGVMSSFGERQLPLVTVYLSIMYGRLSIDTHNKLGASTSTKIAFIQGSGYKDRMMTIRGSIDDVNSNLASLQYICPSNGATGINCKSGGSDTIQVMVDDEGFFGRGGPLTASATIELAVLP